MSGCATCPEVPGSPLCADCPDAEVRPGDQVRVGTTSVDAAGAVYAWTEPAFHVWSAVLPLLLVPPAIHVLQPHDLSGHAHTWLYGFGAVWLLCWLLAVPYTCQVAYRDGRVTGVRCGTRGQALRLASAVRKRIGAPG